MTGKFVYRVKTKTPSGVEVKYFDSEKSAMKFAKSIVADGYDASIDLGFD